MVYLIITILIAGGFLRLYRILRWKSLRVSGISFGLLSILFYLFIIKDLEIASTPAYYKVYNQTDKSLKAYYLIFYPDAELRIIEHERLSPNEHSNSPSFEVEGAKEIWLVIAHQNRPTALHKITDSLYGEKVIHLREGSGKMNAAEEQFVATRLSKYRTMDRIKTALIVLIISTMGLLLFSRKNEITDPRRA